MLYMHVQTDVDGQAPTLQDRHYAVSQTRVLVPKATPAPRRHPDSKGERPCHFIPQLQGSSAQAATTVVFHTDFYLLASFHFEVSVCHR